MAPAPCRAVRETLRRASLFGLPIHVERLRISPRDTEPLILEEPALGGHRENEVGGRDASFGVQEAFIDTFGARDGGNCGTLRRRMFR